MTLEHETAEICIAARIPRELLGETYLALLAYCRKSGARPSRSLAGRICRRKRCDELRKVYGRNLTRRFVPLREYDRA